ncbi:MAG: hypothetical protein AB1782_18180 [Cyanobacteriota bacterium]
MNIKEFFLTKPSIKQISIVLATIIIIFIVSLAILYKINIDKIEINNKITEQILNTSIPYDYTTIAAKCNNNSSCLSILSSKNLHSIVLVEGPLLKDNKDKERVLNSINNAIFYYKGNKYLKIPNIYQENALSIKNKNLLKYKISVNEDYEKTTGMATIVNKLNKSLLFVCLAKSDIYQEQVAIDFLKEYIISD